MNNPNNPRGQMPDDKMKKPGGSGKPMGDQMGQKAQPKDGQDDMSKDMDKNKSNDMKKGIKPDQGQGTRQH